VNNSKSTVVRLDLLVQFDVALVHPEVQKILVSSTSYATDTSPGLADGRELGGWVGFGVRAELPGYHSMNKTTMEIFVMLTGTSGRGGSTSTRGRCV
jgi:hypothetical protein